MTGMGSGIIASMASTPATDRRSGSPATILYGLIRSMRPRQAPKNGLVLIALFFTVNKWWDLDQLEGMVWLIATSASATLIFIIVSGVVYIVNDLFDAERANHDAAQFCDVDYFEFIKDPIAAVEGIYRQFDIDFTDAARTAMTDMHAESQKGPRAPKHTYSLADYGLTDEQVRERFKGR